MNIPHETLPSAKFSLTLTDDKPLVATVMVVAGETFCKFRAPAHKMARAKLNMLRNTLECTTTKENVVKLNMRRQKRLEERNGKKNDKTLKCIPPLSAFG